MSVIDLIYSLASPPSTPLRDDTKLRGAHSRPPIQLLHELLVISTSLSIQCSNFDPFENYTRGRDVQRFINVNPAERECNELSKMGPVSFTKRPMVAGRGFHRWMALLVHVFGLFKIRNLPTDLTFLNGNDNYRAGSCTIVSCHTAKSRMLFSVSQVAIHSATSV